MVSKRNSSIEILKIFAIFIIVISHIAKTVTKMHLNATPDISAFYETIATENFSQLFLVFLVNLGNLGNNIFFVCSAWFLVENNKIKYKKVLNFLFTTWFISLSFFLIFLTFKYNYQAIDILNCIFPITFLANWYVTCYLILYLLHPLLNKLINKFTKKVFIIVNLVLTAFYLLFHYATGFIPANLLTLFYLYFIISYMKKYCEHFNKDVSLNVGLLILNSILIVYTYFVTNELGLNFSEHRYTIKYAYAYSCLFQIIISISLFNIASSKTYVVKWINYLSSLTLYIYLIHENYLIREYLNPTIFVFIHNNFSYAYILLYVLIVSNIYFFASLIIAIIFKYTYLKLINLISDKIIAKYKILVKKHKLKALN